jgi:catechol 2,3-dioxygenase-like lactoylglutathione lyase family enzyme
MFSHVFVGVSDFDRALAFYEPVMAALANGGTCDGPPGPRPEYHAHHDGAHVRDPDGSNLCTACHDGGEDGAGAARGRRPAAAR